jgi:hypothetical protein
MPVPAFTNPENWGMIEKFTSNDVVLSPDGIPALLVVPLVPLPPELGELELVVLPEFEVLGELEPNANSLVRGGPR